MHWVIKGRRPSGFYETQAALALILGGLSATAVRSYGLSDSVESWATWIIPILGATVLGGVFLVFLLVAHVLQDARPRSASGKGAPNEVPPGTIELLKRRRAGVGQLSEVERAAIQRDIHAAIDDLADRRLISEAEAQRARGAELGALDLHMPRTRASAR